MRYESKKRWWRLVGLAVGAGIMLAAASGGAAPGDYLKLVPASHEAFIYVDVKQARNSETWKKLKGEILNPNVQSGLAMLEQFTGMRLPDDLDVVAASGKVAQENEGCIYIHGRMDRARLESFVAMNPAYTETKVPGGTILGWVDEGKGTMTYATFLKDDLVVIGQKPGIEAVLSVAAGDENSMAENPTAKLLLADAATSPLAIGMAVRPKTLPPGVAKVPVIQKVQSALVALTKGSGKLTLTARIEARSQEVARQFLDLGRGIIALGQLQEIRPKLAELAGRTTVAQHGTVVEAKTSVQLAEAETFLRNQIRKNRSRRPNVGGMRVRGNQQEKPVPPQW